MAHSDNTRGIVFMCLSMAGFTLNDTAMKLATETLPLAQAIAVRGVMSFVGLLLLAAAFGGLRFQMIARDRRLLSLRTLAEVGATVSFLLALRQMPIANLSAIMQALPLAVTLAAAIVLREPVGWRRFAAIGIGFCGVLIIVRPGPDGFNLWALAGLASVAFVVLRDLATRAFSATLPSVTVALVTSFAVTVVGAIGLVWNGWAAMTGREVALMAAAASMLMFGYIFAVKAMRVGEVALIAPFRYTALIWAIFLGWLAFDDLPDAVTLAGAALVVATGLYSYLRENQLSRRIAATKSAMTGTATPDR